MIQSQPGIYKTPDLVSDPIGSLGGSIPNYSAPKNPSIENKIISVVDAVTKVPGLISDFGDNLNNKIISIADRSQDKARENVTENKINSIGRNAGKWLQSGNNALYAIGAVLAVIFVIRKL